MVLARAAAAAADCNSANAAVVLADLRDMAMSAALANVVVVLAELLLVGAPLAKSLEV